jgi:zinc protease
MTPKKIDKRPMGILLWTLSFLVWTTIPLQAMSPIERITLPNKLVILVSEERSLPFVTCQILIDGGSRQDPAGKEGLAYLTTKGMLLGTARLKAEAINEALDFMGASLSASAGKDYSTINFRVLKKDLEKGLAFLADTILRPVFPEEELEREKREILGMIQSSEERPGVLADKAFNKVIFPNSPYAHPVEGLRESVPGLSRSDVLRFYQTVCRSNNAILSVVGDISLDEVKTKIVPIFSQWTSGAVNKISVATPVIKKGERVEINRDLSQANIIIGGIGVERANSDYYTLSVMNYILGGGGFGSRLMEEIRVKRGLAYSVSSFLEAQKYQGTFQIVLQTKNASAREAISLSLKEMERMRQEMVSEETLQRAKNYLIGSFPMRFDTQGKLVSFLSLIEYFGLGLDYPKKYPSRIQSIRREDIFRVSQKYLHPEQTLQVVVGNLKEAALESAEDGLNGNKIVPPVEKRPD